MTKTSLMVTALFVLGLIGAYSVYQPFILSITVAVLLSMATFNMTKSLVDMTGSAHISAAYFHYTFNTASFCTYRLFGNHRCDVYFST